MDNIVKFKRSSVTGKLPLPSQLAYGELAVNFSANNPFLSIKNNQDQIEKFLSEKGLMSLLTESYYDKQTINQMFEAFNPSGDVSFDNYYEKAEADAKFQTQSGMSSYLTIAQAEQDLQPKGDYALQSQIPDTSNFITSGFCEDRYQPKGTYVVPSDLNNYVTSGYAEETFAKKGDVPTDVYTKSETDNLLAGKANSAHTHTASEIVDLDVPKIWKGTLAEYTNLTEIDNDTLYVITDESEQFVTSGEVESMISGYTTLSEVEVLLGGFSHTGHTHVMSDITDLNIPSIEGLATEAELANYQPVSAMTNYSQTGHTHSQYLTQTSADSRYARVVSCTQAEYDALVQNDQVEQGVLYCISEGSQSSSGDSGGSGNSGGNYIPDDPIIPGPDDPDPDDGINF